MNEIFAQGDLLIERVPDVSHFGTRVMPDSQGAIVVLDGETTGHRHAFHDAVLMFRDDALARDVPDGLYVGHVRVLGETAKLEHEEHAAIEIPRGTWRVRRQREMEPKQARVIQD